MQRDPHVPGRGSRDGEHRARLPAFSTSSPPKNGGAGGREVLGRQDAHGRGLGHEVWGRWAGALVTHIFGKKELDAMTCKDIQSELARCFRLPSLLCFFVADDFAENLQAEMR